MQRDKLKKIGNIDLIRQSFNRDSSPRLHQFVRMSFSNKTVVYKKRIFTESEKMEREGHMPSKIVVVKQSPRMKTEPSCSELKGCKSLLNTKVK